jgi:hypothetical protein
MEKLLENNRTIIHQLNLLGRCISNNKIYLPVTLSKFVFLCGANKSLVEISERRKALIKFSKEHLPHTHFFLAEKVFSILQAEGHKGNQLDIENEISEFADAIIIILESVSAFTELGAFAHKDLRDKLIVINDKTHENTVSFINLGPIKAIKDSGKKNRVITYKMDEDGVMNRDRIGEVFNDMYNHFKDKTLPKVQKVGSKELNPGLNFNKYSLMFVHDLIYMIGALKYKELIKILIILFGENSYDKLKEHLGMLGAIDAIEKNKKNNLYRSRLGSLYLKYGFDVFMTLSVFRHIYQKHMPERVYEY